MKKLFILLIAVIGFNCVSAAQDYWTRRHTVYAEFGGNAEVYSVNYDRFFPFRFKQPIFGVGMRIGLGYFPWNKPVSNKKGGLSIPVELYGSFGSKHSVEVGYGFTYNRYEKIKPDYDHCYRLGYRYTGNGGLVVRVAPVVKQKKDRWRISPGVGLGYSF
jgi:hypothetical protein